jgi:hypothetical protein
MGIATTMSAPQTFLQIYSQFIPEREADAEKSAISRKILPVGNIAVAKLSINE